VFISDDDGNLLININLDTIFIGYNTGFLKNFQPGSNERLWEIPAHRGNINCIFVNPNYILTGGQDGILRVWTRTTHELTIQFSAHHKDTLMVFPDMNKPNLIYTCGGDRNLNCFDLKLHKRVNLHSLKNGTLTGIAQRKDDNNEISKIYY